MFLTAFSEYLFTNYKGCRFYFFPFSKIQVNVYIKLIIHNINILVN